VTTPRMLITSGGKHPANKWAEHAADEIVSISEQAPQLLLREAREFRAKLIGLFTKHNQCMMDHEQEQIQAGKHHPDLPYETEDYASKVRDEVCGLAVGSSFAEHFQQEHVRAWVEGICNKYFKSVKMVERQHFHTENAATKNRKKK